MIFQVLFNRANYFFNLFFLGNQAFLMEFDLSFLFHKSMGMS
jgi:hypothetical protein